MGHAQAIATLLLASFKTLQQGKPYHVIKASNNSVFHLGMRLSEHKCGTDAWFAFFCRSLTRANAPDLRF